MKLQKGNWLKIGNNVGKFIASDCSGAIFLDVDGFVYKDLSDNCEPIQITQEWLVDKFGFIKDGTKNKYNIKLNNIDFEVHLFNEDGNVIFINKDIYNYIRLDGDVIKYVHQLQNIVFSLTNQELEIK